MQEKIKRINISEFMSEGYLQEINRLFLHPLGLALEVVIDDNGIEKLGGIWDYREDKEGIIFADDMIDKENALRIQMIVKQRLIEREFVCGFQVQPIDYKSPKGFLSIEEE